MDDPLDAAATRIQRSGAALAVAVMGQAGHPRIALALLCVAISRVLATEMTDDEREKLWADFRAEFGETMH